MRSLTTHPPASPASSDSHESQSLSLPGYPRSILFLYYFFAFYLVLPLVDFPVLGLSLSAPVFFVIAVTCLVNPPEPWFRQNQRWILLAAMIWSGVFIATAGNGLLSWGVAINSEGILTVIRYGYWLLVFVVTTHLASRGEIIKKTVWLLGWGILLLALLRWVEVIFLDKIGAWTGTRFLAQNDYGFLFSTFSPFLLVFLLQAKGSKFLFALLANVILWGAVAVNGSRGSWISLGIGMALALFLLFRTNPRKFMGLLAGVLLTGGIFAVLMISSPKILSTLLDRFYTFQRLDADKSYAIRQLMNRKALLLFEEAPLIGVGTARFRLSTVPLEIPQLLSYAPQEHFDRKSAHNSYLSFLAEHGLAGAIPFGLLLATLGLQAFKTQRQLFRQNEVWGLAVFLSFVQMSIHMWAISSITNTANWFIYGLAAAMIMMKTSRGDA